MKRYYYKAVKDRTELVKGYVEANTLDEASDMVRSFGFLPTSIYEDGLRNEQSTNNSHKKTIRLSTSALLVFTSELQTLLMSGIPILQALDNISKYAPDIKIKSFARDIFNKIKMGDTFAQALRAYENTLGTIYVALVKTGEDSGALPETLMYLRELLKNKIELRNKIIHISIYPAILFTMLILEYLLFGGMIFPTMIERLTITDIPPIATFFIKGTNAIQSYWWLFTVVIASSFMFVNYTIGFNTLKNKIANILAGFPITKDCMIYISLSHYMSAMYISYKSGVPILEALKLSRETIPTQAIKEKALKVESSVRRGKSLTESFLESEILPPIMLSIISTGEQTGKLEKMFLDIANSIKERLNNAIEILTQTFPVVMLLIAGGGVAIAAVAMLQMYMAAITSAI